MLTLSYSDWLGLAGIFISLLGFWISIVQIRKTNTAAESAKDSADQARSEIRRLDTLLEFASVSKAMDDIKSAFIESRFATIPRLLDVARKSLIAAAEGKVALPEFQRDKVDKTIKFLTDLEATIIKGELEQDTGKHSKIVRLLIEHSNNVNTMLILAKSGTK